VSTQKSLQPSYSRITPIKNSWYMNKKKKILDLSGQTLNLSFGEPPSEIKKAVIDEINKNAFFSSRFGSQVFDDLSTLLTKNAPPNICCINHKLSDGSDAVETALKLGCENIRSTNIIALKNAWHGETMATLQLSNKLRSKYLGSNVNIDFTSGTNLESLIEKVNNTNKPSVVILDPIGFSTGLFEFHQIKTLLPKLREICQKKGHFLIFDEIQSFGGYLNGKLFSYDVFNVESDAIAIGKALGQGFPISACLYSNEFSELLYNEAEFTHGGQPPACAAAISGINYLFKHQSIIDKSIVLWNKFLDELECIFNDSLFVIRKVGFICSLTPNDKLEVYELTELLFESGLIVRKGNSSKSILIKAPINFDEDMYIWAIKIFKESILKLKNIKSNRQYIEIGNKHNKNISNIELLLKKFPKILLNKRTINQQYKIASELEDLGIPSPNFIIHNDILSYRKIDGVFLNKYTIKTALEAKSILNQLIDYIIKAHSNNIIIGNRCTENTIWNGTNIIFCNFDIGYKNKNKYVMTFEHLFLLLNHIILIPKELNRVKIIKPYLFELVDIHNNNDLKDIAIKFQNFFNSQDKTEEFLSVSIDQYKEVLDEFLNIINDI